MRDQYFRGVRGLAENQAAPCALPCHHFASQMYLVRVNATTSDRQARVRLPAMPWAAVTRSSHRLAKGERKWRKFLEGHKSPRKKESVRRQAACSKVDGHYFGARGTVGQLLYQFRRLIAADQAAQTDGQLLERYVTRHDEEAFTSLVQRHGPMVLNVCRVVGDHVYRACSSGILRCWQPRTFFLPRIVGQLSSCSISRVISNRPVIRRATSGVSACVRS